MKGEHLDIDGSIPQVKVRQQLRTQRGKGDKIAIATLKTKWSRRTLPLHPSAVAWLKKHRKGIEADAFVFGDGTERPEDSDPLREDLASAGLPTEYKNGESFVFYSLRHTFATLLGEAGVLGELIDRMLGQAPATTRGRHYQAPSLDAMHRAVCLIDLGQLPVLSQPIVPGGRRKPSRRTKTPRKTLRPGPDSNRRMTVLQTVA